MTTDVPRIAEQVADWQRGAAAEMPSELLGAFAADQSSLEAGGVPAGVAKPGTAMPDSDLLDIHGQPTSLARLRRGRPAVVVFYRGAWCPYCNIALRTYQAELVPALTDRGIDLVAISPQTPDGSLTIAEQNDLTFSVVSDPGNQIAAALGILTQPIPEAITAMGALGLDLREANADGTRRLPMPTTVIIDVGGAIRWIDVHPNYTSRSEVSEILAAVDELL